MNERIIDSLNYSWWLLRGLRGARRQLRFAAKGGRAERYASDDAAWYRACLRLERARRRQLRGKVS